MSLNYFIGQPKDWLVQQLQLCQADMAKGKVLIQWGAGDSSSISKVQLSPEERFRRLYYALSQLDPTTYPPQAGRRQDRTTAIFS